MRSVVVAMLVWLLTCTIGGFVTLARLGDYGSIAQPIIGVVMGVLGALSAVLLNRSSRFRSFGLVRRALLNWLSAYLPFAALAIAFTNFKLIPYSSNFLQEAIRFFGIYTALPMLVVALLASTLSGLVGRKNEALFLPRGRSEK
jgi:hypothetical protein